MNRKAKIDFLASVANSENDLNSLWIKTSIPLPTWYWQQFETEHELLQDLRKGGREVDIIWEKGRPHKIDYNTNTNQPKWFPYE